MSSDEEVLKLRAQLAALEKSLGVQKGVSSEGEAKSFSVPKSVSEEKARELFQSWDTNSNGSLELKELQVLGYECKVDTSLLTEKALKEIFPKIEDGVDFDTFYAWFKEQGESQGGSGNSWLRMQLMSKSVFHKVQQRKKEGGGEKKTEGGDGGRNMADIHVSLGDFKEAKSGIYLFTKGKEDATALREQGDLDEDVAAFAFIDIAVAEDASEETLGELVGVLDQLLSTLNLDSIIPMYSSHNVDLVEHEDGNKAIRISVQFSINPMELLLQMIGMNSENGVTDIINQIGSLNASLEFPFGVDDLKDGDFRFTEDALQSRLKIKSAVTRESLESAKAMVDALDPPDDFQLLYQLAAAQFFQGLTVSLQFDSLKVVTDMFKDEDFEKWSWRDRDVRKLLKGLAMVAQIPIAQMVEQKLNEGAMILSMQLNPQMRELYGKGRQALIGISSIQAVMGDNVLGIALKGLDFIKLLPVELPSLGGGDDDVFD